MTTTNAAERSGASREGLLARHHLVATTNPGETTSG